LPKLSSRQQQALDRNKDLLFASSSAFWAQENIVLESGLKFSFKNRRFLMMPYFDDHPKQAHEKCTQMGISTAAILKVIHHCIYLFPLGTIYFFPTDTDVRDFSKGRVNPIIRSNPAIRSVADDTDEVGLKKVGKSFIYFRGMKSKVAMKSVPADMIVIDEKDEASQDSCNMARKRLSASEFKFEYALSNPTIPNYGIDKDFQESDQRYWMIKCPHCGNWNCLEDSVMEQELPKCLVKVSENEAFIGCLKCARKLDVDAGEWVAKFPSKDYVHGYHYSQLFSPTIEPIEIVREFEEARKTGHMKNFMNLTLGLPHVTAKEKLEAESVLQLCDPDFPKDPFAGGGVFMGIDQGSDLHVCFKRKISDTKILTWYAWHRDFKELEAYMPKVTKAVIDALPETRAARAFAMNDRWKGKVFLNYYNDHQKGSTKWDEKEMIVQENRTESLDASHSHYAEKRNILPPRSPEIEKVAKQLSNTAKKLEEDEEGSKRYVWVKLGADHYRHADNYSTIAMESASNAPKIY
jgi:hypothetical protein